MPIYEYECQKCGNFEKFQKITEENLKKCPTCGNDCKRIISTTSPPQFKGAGFYEVDYKNKK